MYQKGNKQIYNELFPMNKKSYTCIMLRMLIIFISFMLLCHVHIKAESSGFSFDEVFKLTVLIINAIQKLTRYKLTRTKIDAVQKLTRYKI